MLGAVPRSSALCLSCFLSIHLFAHFFGIARQKKPNNNIRPKKYITSTTPSCGGPLRAQIFQKVCFYKQKYDFWPIRTRFDPFKWTPRFIFSTRKPHCSASCTTDNSMTKLLSLSDAHNHEKHIVHIRPTLK